MVRKRGRGRRSRAQPGDPKRTPAPDSPRPDPGLELATPPEPPPLTLDALAHGLHLDIDRLRAETLERDRELIRAVQRVADTYEHLARQLEADRAIQALLAEGMYRLERRFAALERSRSAPELAPPGPRVVGGTISPPPALPETGILPAGSPPTGSPPSRDNGERDSSTLDPPSPPYPESEPR